MTKQEKTYDTRKFKLCRIMAKAMADLPKGYQLADVLALWQAIDGYGPDLRCDAFWLMDNDPGRFADYQVWHPRLRSLRNQPHLGEQLFECFQ